jgi:hypothetical protein
VRFCRNCEHVHGCKIHPAVRDDPSYHCSRFAKSKELEPIEKPGPTRRQLDEKRIRADERKKYKARLWKVIESRISGDYFPRQFLLLGEEKRAGYMRAWREIEQMLREADHE